MTMLARVALFLLLPGLSNTLVSAQECEGNGTCELKDSHERCPVWAKEGLCIEEYEYMDKYCPRSCSLDSSIGDEECVDQHPRCDLYASVGECETNPQMSEYCPKSCNFCGESEEDEGESCVDSNAKCKYWASEGECEENPIFMTKNCKKSCEICTPQTGAKKGKSAITDDLKSLQDATEKFGNRQKAEGSEKPRTIEFIRKSLHYMETEASSLPHDVVEKCLNRHELCSFWAAIGECEANQAYMVTNCAPSCRTCNLIDMESRCPPLENAKPALVPGGLNKMFEKIVEAAPGNRTLSDEERRDLQEKEIPEYTVTVYSRPSDVPSTKISAELDRKLPPWVVVLDNFTTPEECKHVIDLGYKSGYERSRDVGKKLFDGSYDAQESTRRTSHNAWCSERVNCRQDEVIQRLHNRMGEVMGIAPENSEDFQLLKYEKGQFYRKHHDYIPHHRDRQCGPRILTFFLYLSDVEDGGGTAFPDLGIKVEPKRGRALLWPSIIDSAPLEKDGRMMHEALEVKAGTKYAANGWIHLYDYITPEKKGCT